MTNENLTTDVINRLKYFMEQIGVSVTQFADNTGIQRSSMSQILGGRNQKISIITIGKIHDAYPQLSLTWLLSGEGSMTSNGEETKSITLSDEVISEKSSPGNSDPELPFLSLFSNENAINADERSAVEKYSTENDLKMSVKTVQIAESKEVNPNQTVNIEPQKAELKNKRVIKIMIFYSDNTFETFSPDSFK